MFLPNVEFFSHHAIPLPARRTHPKLLSDSSSTVPPRCEQHADRRASRCWGASNRATAGDSRVPGMRIEVRYNSCVAT